MAYYLIKLFLSAGIIVVVSEVSKRSGTLGGLIASLPLTSLLAIVWLYVDTRDVGKVARLGMDIFWLVLPSLVFFILLPFLLHRGLQFWLALALSAGATAGAYAGTLRLLAMARAHGP